MATPFEINLRRDVQECREVLVILVQHDSTFEKSNSKQHQLLKSTMDLVWGSLQGSVPTPGLDNSPESDHEIGFWC